MAFIAAAIGAAGAIGGSLLSSSAASNSANTLANSANASAAVTQNMFNTTQQNLAPWISAGGNALGTLQGLLGIPGSTSGTTAAAPASSAAGGLPPGYTVQPSYGMTNQQGQRGESNPVQTLTGYSVIGPNGQVVGTLPAESGGNASSLFPATGQAAPTTGTPTAPVGNALTNPTTLMGTSFQSSPGYQFQLGQGMDAITNSAAARGGIGGGNTLAALQQYGTGLANQDYYNWLSTFYNQGNNYVNQVAGLSGAGQNAAANLGGFSGNAAGQIGNALTGAGSALAAGQVGSANALSGGLSSLSGIDWSSLLAGNSGLNSVTGLGSPGGTVQGGSIYGSTASGF